jgi:hypothetical protein
MKKLCSALAATALLLASLSMLSCSSSDDSGTNNNNNISQAQADQMQALAASLVPFAGVATTTGVTQLDGVDESDFDLSGIVDTQQGVDFSVSYDSSGGWWDAHFSYETEPAADTAVSVTVRDSVRFEDGSGGAQQNPDDLTDLMKNIASIALSTDIPDFGTVGFSMHSNLNYSSLTSPAVTVDGNMSFNLNADIAIQDSTLSGTVAATLEITNLQVPKPASAGDMACPTSGVIVLHVTEDLSAQAVNEGVKSTSWTITVTVLSANSYKIRLDGGGKNFGEVTVNDACSSPLSIVQPLESAAGNFLKNAVPRQ